VPGEPGPDWLVVGVGQVLHQGQGLLPAGPCGLHVAGRLLRVAEASQRRDDQDVAARLPVDRQDFHVGGDGPLGVAEREAGESERGQRVGGQQAGTGLAADVQRPVAVAQCQLILPEPGVDGRDRLL